MEQRERAEARGEARGEQRVRVPVRAPVRIGVVGCGTIARGMHLPGIKQMEGLGKARLVAVCDAVEESARTVAERFEVPRYVTRQDDLLAMDEVDVVVNLTPIPQHFEVSLAALRAGKHVYTQKPMTTTVDEATLLVEEARRAGRLLACAPEHAVRPVIRTMARLVRDGEIGAVAFCRVLSSHDGPEKHDVPRDSTWYYQPGSSPILDLGVHGLAQITSILGPVRRLSCASGRSQDVRLTTAGPFKGKRIDVRIDDNSLLLLEFGPATFGFLDATYCVEASFSPRLEIYGSAGTLAITRPPDGSPAPGGPALRCYDPATKAWQAVEVPAGPDVRDLGVLHLVDCLLTGEALVLTAEHARHLVEVMTAAPRAAAEGRAVPMQTAF